MQLTRRGAAIAAVFLGLRAVASCSQDSSSPRDAGVDASDAPTGDAGMPIRHVVVVVKENHTFDNYFGAYPGVTPQPTATLHDGTVLTRPMCPSGGIPRDLPHGHDQAVVAYADGGMNGLDLVPGTVAPPDGGTPDYLAWCTFDGANQLGIYFQLASEFTLADRFFTTTLGPSFPGHLATVAGQSPAYSNPSCPLCPRGSAWGCVDPESSSRVPTFDPDTGEAGTEYPCWDLPTWLDELPPSMGWRVYGTFEGYDDAGAPVIVSPFNALKAHSSPADRKAHFFDESQLLTDVATLPSLPAVLYWNDVYEDSEHPPSSPCPGEQRTLALLDALAKRPEWNETAVLVTFDDWGGFYDHVAPPVERCPNGAVYNPGFRVPLFVVSPYARKGFVFHDVTEQASVPRFIEEVFGLPFASARDPHARDGRAGSLLGAFDFTQPPRAMPAIASDCSSGGT